VGESDHVTLLDKTWMHIIFIVLLACLGLGYLWQGGMLPYSVHSDVLTYHLSMKSTLYQSISQGHMPPFWRADQLSGMPVLNNPQALYFFPLHLPFWFLPPEQAMGPVFWLLLLCSSLGCYVLGMVLKLRTGARLVMAAAGLFAFKLLIAVYAGWLVPLSAIVLLPWLWAALLAFFEKPSLVRSLALAFVGMWCLHVGYIQLIFYSGLLAVGLWAAKGVSLGKKALAEHGDDNNKGRVVHAALPFLKMGGWLFFAVALAVGVSAYLWFPLLFEASLASRTGTSYAFFLSGHAFEWRHLLTLFAPEALGSPLLGTYPGAELWEDVAYFGLLPLLLACVGSFGGWKRPYVRFLTVSFVGLFFLAADTPLLWIVYKWVPGFKLFRCPARMSFIAMYFGIILAGVGVELLLRWSERFRWGGVIAVTLCLAVISVEGMSYARSYITMRKHKDIIPTPAWRTKLGSAKERGRLATVGRFSLNYGWSGPLKVELISGYEPYNLRHYQKYFSLMQHGRPVRMGARVWTDLNGIKRWDLFNALNTTHLLSAAPLKLPKQLEKIGSYPGQRTFLFYRGWVKTHLSVYRNKSSQGRAVWMYRVIEAKDARDMMRGVLGHSIQNTTVVLTGRRAIPKPMKTIKQPSGSIHLSRKRPGELLLLLKTDTRRFLRISEVWHPGWRATFNGRPIRLYRADIALMGVWVPAGGGRLELRFRPIYWEGMKWISLLSLVAFLCMFAFVCWRRLSGEDRLPKEAGAESE